MGFITVNMIKRVHYVMKIIMKHENNENKKGYNMKHHVIQRRF